MIAMSACCRPLRNKQVPRRGAGVSHGFTLTEVLIVLVIVGLALGMTGTSLDNYRIRIRIENEARSMSAEIRRAQQASVMTGNDQQIDAGFVERLLRSAVDTGTRTLGPPREGMAVTVINPVKIGHDGACTDGRFIFDWRGMRYALAVSAPFCDSSITRIE